MKTNKQFENDKTLGVSLRQWTINATLPPRFQDRVWQRIEGEESKPVATLADMLRGWLERTVMRPVVGLSFVTALLVLGLTVGYRQARMNASQAESAWQARYVQSVDPFQPAQHSP